MIEIRHPDNDPNFLAKTQEFKDTHPKICRGKMFNSDHKSDHDQIEHDYDIMF
jgi:hypothetical protein